MLKFYFSLNGVVLRQLKSCISSEIVEILSWVKQADALPHYPRLGNNAIRSKLEEQGNHEKNYLASEKLTLQEPHYQSVFFGDMEISL